MQRMLSGAFSSSLAVFSSNISNLLTGIFLVHLLGKNIYGQYGMLRSTLNMFIIFSSFSLGMTATKYIAEFREQDKEKVGKIIGLSVCCISFLAIVLFVACYLSADYLAEYSLNSVALAPKLRIGAWMILFAVLNSIFTGIFSGFESFSVIAKINIVGAIILLAGSFIGAKYWKIDGALIALSAYLAGMLILSVIFLHRELKRNNVSICFRKCFDEFSVLWRFSLPVVLGSILVTPVLWLGNSILIKSPAGYAAMAGLDVINQWKTALIFIPSIIGRITLPILSNLKASDRTADYFKAVKFNLLINSGITFLGAIVLSVFSKFILSLYGHGFAEYIVSFCIVMFTTVLNAANGIVGQIILSQNLAWWGFLFNVLWAVLFLACIYGFIVIGNFGVLGIAFAFAISYLGHTFWQFLFLYSIGKNKKYNLTMRLK